MNLSCNYEILFSNLRDFKDVKQQNIKTIQFDFETAPYYSPQLSFFEYKVIA